MPKDMLGTLGNSEETRIKQKHFREIVRPHMKIVKSILNRFGGHKHGSHYFYIDMNAGCGWYNDRRKSFFVGSPVISIEEASLVGVDLNGYFIESLPASVIWLKKAIDHTNKRGFSTNIVNMDHRSCVVDIVRSMGQDIKPYGLIYNDPSGTDPSFDVLADLASLPQARCLDILIYCSATNIKRKIKAAPSKYSQRLSAGMALIDKKHWIIRKPRCAHQWTFLIGTNWTQFPVFRGQGFVQVDSDEGRLVLDTLDLTKDEFMVKHCGTQLTFRDYESYLKSREFGEIRKHVIQRSNGRCEVCGSQKASEVHHCIYPPRGTVDSPDNLKAICHSCHCRVHGKDT